ncbi:hypothetical protein ACX93W_25760 [Paenibacillus sp. CAU 1782]
MSINNVMSPLPQGGEAETGQSLHARRTWRVGSLSMGITLMLIGAAFAVSLWQEAEVYQLLLWVAPVVFILLGAELLLYLALSGKRETVVRYDWLSVLFVGLIGTASLVLALLMSSGVFNELQRNLNMTQRTVFVESDTLEVPGAVKKIVLQSSIAIAINETDANEVKLMGQIRYWSPDKPEAVKRDLMNSYVVGETLFLIIGDLDRRENAIAPEYARYSELMLALPRGLEIEER